jgi:glycosyltransferase A (GT-A) superfamily protein (DUF2064 family)
VEVVARPAAPDEEVVARLVAPDVEAVARLVASDVEVFAQPGRDRSERLVGAIGAVFARTGRGPLLVAGTAVPRLAPGHAAAALTDIAEGCDATFGPALDGGFYLAGLAGPQSAIFALPDEVWAGADLLGTVIGRAHEHGLELGLLRYERELRGPLDVHAMLADPLSPPDVVAALRAAM